jgi:multidrug transporter EmrE-like cation transporter
MDILKSNWFPWILVIGASINTCIGNLLLKKSSLLLIDQNFLNRFLSPYFLAGLFFYGINVLLFAKSLEKLPVSIAYPVFSSLGFFLLAISSNYLFNESFSGFTVIGLVLIICGIILISVK